MRVGSQGLALTQADLAPVALFRPHTIGEAIDAFEAAPRPVAVYAGGTDFFARLREGMRPSALVWIDKIAVLRVVERTEDALTLGALLTHHEAADHPQLSAVRGLSAAWRAIANVRIRRLATLGGNLMARRTRYELSILLTALAATAQFIGPAGARSIPVEQIFGADFSGHPLLVSVTIPLNGAPAIDYERAMRPVFTQAACVRTTHAGRTLRTVIATEHLRPFWADQPIGPGPIAPLADLPADYSDPAVSRAYLAKAGSALLRRQLARLEAQP